MDKTRVASAHIVIYVTEKVTNYSGISTPQINAYGTVDRDVIHLFLRTNSRPIICEMKCDMNGRISLACVRDLISWKGVTA